MTLVIPNAIENDTPADAVEVDDNYQYIEEYVNANLIHRDGSVTMTGPLHLAGNPISNNDAVPKSYVDVVLPVGAILPYGGISAPDDWVLCDGTAYTNASMPKLANVLQGKYNKPGTVAGSFCVPDLRARVPVGMDSTNTHYSATGRAGGSTKVPVPEHDHDMSHNHPAGTTGNETQNHQHPITHNHASFKTKGAGEHQHTSEYTSYQNMTVGTGPYFARRIVDTGAQATSTVAGTGDHEHDVDVPQYTGDSASQNLRHNHSFDVANIVQDTKTFKLEVIDSLNQKSTTDFYAPYVTINYIIKKQ